MKKVYLMKGMAAMTLGLVVASCNKADIFNAYADQEVKEQEFTENFQNNVMGGKTIDPNQNWSTAVQSNVTVSVNLDNGVDYNVYVFTANPVLDKSAAYIGTAVVTSGQTKTISVARPADVETLYVAYMDTKGNMFATPVSASDANVTLGTVKAASNAARRAGEATVTITTIATPDVAEYKAGAVALTDANVGEIEFGKKMIIEQGTKLTAIVYNVFNTYGGTIYVEGEWEISGDQRFGAGTRLIIANGGKVTVKEGGILGSNNDDDHPEILPGLFYVMSGGKLTGDGSVELHNAAGDDMCFIGGTVDVQQYNMNGSKTYVAEGGHLLSEFLQNGDGQAVVINHGEVHVKYASNTYNTGGKGYCRNLAIENACQFTVDYQLTLSNWVDSKIADGGYLSVGALKLDGGNGKHLYMGENAVIEIGQVEANKAEFSGETTNFGQIMIGNFGIVGPSTDNQNRAFIKFCTLQNAYYGDKVLNKLTIIPTEDTPKDNYSWGVFADGVLFGTTANYTIDTSECTAGIKQETNTGGNPKPNYIYYAFEDLGTTDDFDFNDVVIRVSTPNANGVSTVELMAAGGTMPTVVTYGDKTLGSEVHQTFGVEVGTMVNTGAEKKEFKTLGTIEGLSADTDMTKLPFGITVTGNGGQVTRVVNSVENNGKAPLMIVVNGDENGKWFWATERTNITAAYAQFGEWGANAGTNTDWYKNYADGKVWKW
ncbi:MAG: DUF4842 domain-containing protein [Prevotella sp.]|nr:DUF4842 domain-containing protein [Prevotella sp.]